MNQATSSANFELDTLFTDAKNDPYYFGAVTASLLYSACQSLAFQYAAQVDDDLAVPPADASPEEMAAYEERRNNREQRIADKQSLLCLVYNVVTPSFRPSAEQIIETILTQNNPDTLTPADTARINEILAISEAMKDGSDDDEDFDISPTEARESVLAQKRNNHRRISERSEAIIARLNEAFAYASENPSDMNEDWTPSEETAIKIAETLIKKGNDRRVKNKVMALKATTKEEFRNTLLASNRLIKDVIDKTNVVLKRINDQRDNAGNDAFGHEDGVQMH